MHYGDEKQIDENYLDIVVYKHGIAGESDDKYEIMIESIQNCQYIHPRYLTKLLMSFEYMFQDEIEKLEFEQFILMRIKDTTGYGDFEIFWSMPVDDIKEGDLLSDFNGLH